jgi:hypothetical protein
VLAPHRGGRRDTASEEVAIPVMSTSADVHQDQVEDEEICHRPGVTLKETPGRWRSARSLEIGGE